MFRFESLSDFIQMSGHGPYVWSAYVISLVVLVWLVVNPWLRRKRFLREMIRQQQRELARQQFAEQDNENAVSMGRE